MSRYQRVSRADEAGREEVSVDTETAAAEEGLVQEEEGDFVESPRSKRRRRGTHQEGEAKGEGEEDTEETTIVFDTEVGTAIDVDGRHGHYEEEEEYEEEQYESAAEYGEYDDEDEEAPDFVCKSEETYIGDVVEEGDQNGKHSIEGEDEEEDEDGEEAEEEGVHGGMSSPIRRRGNGRAAAAASSHRSNTTNPNQGSAYRGGRGRGRGRGRGGGRGGHPQSRARSGETTLGSNPSGRSTLGSGQSFDLQRLSWTGPTSTAHRQTTAGTHHSDPTPPSSRSTSRDTRGGSGDNETRSHYSDPGTKSSSGDDFDYYYTDRGAVSGGGGVVGGGGKDDKDGGGGAAAGEPPSIGSTSASRSASTRTRKQRLMEEQALAAIMAGPDSSGSTLTFGTDIRTLSGARDEEIEEKLAEITGSNHRRDFIPPGESEKEREEEGGMNDGGGGGGGGGEGETVKATATSSSGTMGQYVDYPDQRHHPQPQLRRSGVSNHDQSDSTPWPDLGGSEADESNGTFDTSMPTLSGANDEEIEERLRQLGTAMGGGLSGGGSGDIEYNDSGLEGEEGAASFRSPRSSTGRKSMVSDSTPWYGPPSRDGLDGVGNDGDGQHSEVTDASGGFSDRSERDSDDVSFRPVEVGGMDDSRKVVEAGGRGEGGRGGGGRESSSWRGGGRGLGLGRGGRGGRGRGRGRGVGGGGRRLAPDRSDRDRGNYTGGTVAESSSSRSTGSESIGARLSSVVQSSFRHLMSGRRVHAQEGDEKGDVDVEEGGNNDNMWGGNRTYSRQSRRVRNLDQGRNLAVRRDSSDGADPDRLNRSSSVRKVAPDDGGGLGFGREEVVPTTATKHADSGEYESFNRPPSPPTVPIDMESSDEDMKLPLRERIGYACDRFWSGFTGRGFGWTHGYTRRRCLIVTAAFLILLVALSVVLGLGATRAKGGGGHGEEGGGADGSEAGAASAEGGIGGAPGGTGAGGAAASPPGPGGGEPAGPGGGGGSSPPRPGGGGPGGMSPPSPPTRPPIDPADGLPPNIPIPTLDPVAAAIRLGEIQERIQTSLVTDPKLLTEDAIYDVDDRAPTPQRAALVWIAMLDPKQVDPNDPFLLQRYAMATFWYSTHDRARRHDAAHPITTMTMPGSREEEAPWPNWDVAENWMTGKGICSWYGVSCHHRPGTDTETQYDADGGVTHLNLTSNDLRGHIPPEVTLALPDVRLLDLSDNELTGMIPTQLGSLKELESLYLWGNLLDDCIPASIGDCRKLRNVYLHDNLLYGPLPSELAQCSHLTNVGFHQNYLTGHIPFEWGAINNNWDNVRTLYLDSNMLTGALPIGLFHGLPGAADVRLSDNALTGPIPASVGHLANAEFLYLGGNGLTGALPRRMNQLKHLSELHLGNNQLSGPLPSSWGTGMSDLVLLYLENNRFTGAIPSEWGSMDDLRELFLGQNDIRATIPTQIAGMMQLRDLRLEYNGIGGRIPTELGKMFRLEIVKLEHNNLEGEIPPQLGKLVHLETLTLHGNEDIQGTMPPDICALRSDDGLVELIADCIPHVECRCCTECWDGIRMISLQSGDEGGNEEGRDGGRSNGESGGGSWTYYHPGSGRW